MPTARSSEFIPNSSSRPVAEAPEAPRPTKARAAHNEAGESSWFFVRSSCTSRRQPICCEAVAATLARGLSGVCAAYAAVPVRNSTLDSTEQPLTAATARPARIRVRRFSNMGFLLGRVISLQFHPGVGHDLSLMVTVTEPLETGWTSFQVRSPCFHSFPPTLTFSMPSSVALAMAR